MMPRATAASHRSQKKDFVKAKALRQAPTNGESLLWARLRLAAKGRGCRFRRQHPMHPYIVDFACLRYKIIVEVDGCTHVGREAQDRARDDFLQSAGYEVLRFANSEVLSNPDGVVSVILRHVTARAGGGG